MPDDLFVALTGPDGSIARVAPHLGGWLLRYARPIEHHGLVDALHCTQEVIDRYPRQMYAGNPILFPLVSFNHAPGHEHHFEWDGQLFALPQHGFARRLPWTVVDQSEGSVAMELRDSAFTHTQFPFSFRHLLTYRLVDGRLHWEQVIENLSDSPMPFATGFHPYFAVPLSPKSIRSACFVETPDAHRVTALKDYTSFSQDPFPSQNWSVQEDVSRTLFLSALKKREFILVDLSSRLEVIFNFDDAPKHRFVALWAPSTDEPFYCIEPWTALPNAFARAKDRELIVLPPQNTFRAAFWIEVRATI